MLGERVGWRRWTAILIGFCGVLIALRPSTQTVSWPAMIALGGSLSFAFLMLITRSLRATPDIVLATSQFGGTFLLGALMSPIGWVTPTLGSLGLFAAAGVISVAALLCINRSLKLAPASVVVPYQYSMIVWAVIFGFVVCGDVPSISTIVGAAIIIGAGLLHLPARAAARARGSGGQSAGVSLHASSRPEPDSSSRPCAHDAVDMPERQLVNPRKAWLWVPLRWDAMAASYRSRLVELPQFFSDDQTLRDRRKRSTGVERAQRLEAVQLDAAPLEAAFLQDVARGRVGDAGARDQVLGVEFLEEEIDHRARGFGAKTLAPMLDAEPIAEFRRVRRRCQSMPTMPIGE